MPTIILAHRAEFYSGSDDEVMAAYLAKRKIEHEELRVMAKKSGLPPVPPWEEVWKWSDGS